MAARGAGRRLLEDPPVLTLEAGDRIVRIHALDRGAVFFGPAAGLPPGNRYDAPAGQFRVLYAAERLEGAFAETVLRKPGRILRRADPDARAWTSLRVERPLRLAKLCDEGLHAFGVDAGDLGADDNAFCRQLALEMHGDYPGLDGLAYRSRFNNGELCYAIFDRAQPADLTPVATAAFVEHPNRLDSLISFYRAVFDTSGDIPDQPPP